MGCIHPHASCLSTKKQSSNMAHAPLNAPNDPQPTLYSCDICGQEGMTEVEMRSHVLIEHIEGQISCPFCDLEGTTLEEMNDHINAQHLDYLTPTKALSGSLLNQIRKGTRPFESPSDSSNFDSLRSNTSSTIVSKDLNVDCPTLGENNGISPTEILITPVDQLDKQERNAEAENKENVGGHDPLGKRCNLHLDVPSTSNGKQFKLQNTIVSSNNLNSIESPSTESSDTTFACPMCSWSTTSADDIAQHVNKVHLDLTSPTRPQSGSCISADVVSNSMTNQSADFECPLCGHVCNDGPTLEQHVIYQHGDILSLARSSEGRSVSSHGGSCSSVHCCPVCGMQSSDSTSLQLHVDGHFSAEHTPVDVRDDILAATIADEEKRIEEERHFLQLQEQYGMVSTGNYRRQAVKHLEKAVSGGQMTVADYYSRIADVSKEAVSGVDDGHSSTKGVLERLRIYYKNGVHNVSDFRLCSPTSHFASSFADKGWGCGYRNLQMLLSCLASNPKYLQVVFNGQNQIPSIPKIQQLIESAWEKGFDEQGAQQLGHKVKGTNKWIGATEIVATLSSLKVKCQLVDFHAPTGKDGTHPRLFDWVKNYFKRDKAFFPPLYLQHQGHSRSIIGMEELKDGSVRLLLFDPSCHRQQMQQFVQAPVSANLMRSLRRPPSTLKAKQYQIVAVLDVLTDKDMEDCKSIKSDRIP